MKLGHIAILTKDLNKSIDFYKLLGGKICMQSTLKSANGITKELVHISFDGYSTIELVCPNVPSATTEYTGVCEHLCFDVENIDVIVKELRDKGINTFDKKEPYNLDIFGGIRIIFLTGPNGEMIELLQKI